MNSSAKADYKLGEIPYFQSLVPMSQTATKPIFALRSADGVVGAHFDKVRQFDEVIEQVANRILENIRAMDDVA